MGNSTPDVLLGKVGLALKEAKEAQQRADDLEEDYRLKLEESRSSANALIGDAKATAAKKSAASLSRADKSIEKKLAEAGEALAASPAFRTLSEHERKIAFGAVVLHDIAKPERTGFSSM